MRVRMRETIRGAEDGFTLRTYEAGSEYELEDTPRGNDLAATFLRERWAEEVKPPPPAPAVESPPPAAGTTTDPAAPPPIPTAVPPPVPVVPPQAPAPARPPAAPPSGKRKG